MHGHLNVKLNYKNSCILFVFLFAFDSCTCDMHTVFVKNLKRNNCKCWKELV